MNRINTLFFTLLLITILLSNSTLSHAKLPVAKNVDDIVVVTKIKKQLALDKLVKSLNISVRSHNGTVTLSGVVDSNRKFERVLTLSQSVAGVIDVNAEHLIVKNTPAQRKDMMIQAQIMSQLVKSGLLKRCELDTSPVVVTSNLGYVTLSGQLSSHNKKQLTINTAARTQGVKQVNDVNLNVYKY